MVFWIVISCLVMLAVTYTLLASSAGWLAGIATEPSATELYKSRVKEIERDLSAGRLDKGSADIALAEEGKRLLASSKRSKKSKDDKQSTLPLLVALALVPILTIPLYLSIGNPDHTVTKSESAETASPNNIAQLVEKVESRLKSHPDDLRGWKVVASVYESLGRFDDAENANRQIVRIEGANAQNLSDLGEAMVKANRGTVSEDARKIFAQAVEIDENNPTASFMLGVYDLQTGNREGAINRWQEMVDNAKGNEDWIDAVKERIVAVKSSIAPPDNDAAKAIRELPKGDQLIAIKGMVSGLAARLEDDPSNKQDWLKLVRAYTVLNEMDEAKSAATKAKQYHGSDAEFVRQIDLLLEENR